ncbi:GNAT family N-acetyltransferase [Leptospira gomenensis]|uniref:GNAT family N-acetyltransferase n=1 Tax=Leptospira gomenensis TaxID=2484974 RepID=UPI0014384B6E|nr:GNAT family N-acetyltransferase [Leptospira gomenensis]
MDLNLDWVRIDRNKLDLLDRFLSLAGDSLSTFRYFRNRPTSAIENHIVTVLLLADDHPVAYGHLDPDDSKIWLGIAVVQSAKGLGYGKLMMNYLIRFATEHKIEKLTLSVDKPNSTAIRLYIKNGFVKVGETEKYEIYEWLNENRG